MNAWNRKDGKQNEKYRVTAGGSRNLLIVSAGAATLQTSEDEINWTAVATTTFGGTRTVHSTSVSGELLASFFRVTGPATFYFYQED